MPGALFLTLFRRAFFEFLSLVGGRGGLVVCALPIDLEKYSRSCDETGAFIARH